MPNCKWCGLPLELCEHERQRRLDAESASQPDSVACIGWVDELEAALMRTRKLRSDAIWAGRMELGDDLMPAEMALIDALNAGRSRSSTRRIIEESFAVLAFFVLMFCWLLVIAAVFNLLFR